jgi:hypothetical protein
VIARRTRLESPATIPRGIPTASDSPTAASISARVCRLSAHRPIAAKEASAATIQAAARQPPKRSAASVKAAVVPNQVIHSRSRLNQSTRLSTNVANPSKIANAKLGSAAFRWSDSQVWKLSRWPESEFHVSSAGHGCSGALPSAGSQIRHATYMSATTSATCTSFPRHHGRWATTGAGRTTVSVTEVIGPRLRRRSS